MNTELNQAIEKAGHPMSFPDNETFTGISIANTASLAKTFDLSIKDIEISALNLEIVPLRYSRNMKTLSFEDQKILLESCVSVVGTGGLGGTVSETLARMGVGALKLIDGDCFEESNLNRQLFSTENLMDKSKVLAASDRIRQINSAVEVSCFDHNLDIDNADRLITGSDIAVDCLDNIHTRFTLQNASRSAGVPMVSAAVGGRSGHLTVIFPEDPGLELIFGDPKEAAGVQGAEKTLGNLPFAVSVVASLECAEVVRILLQKESPLRNRLLVIDLNDYTFETLRLA